MSDLICTFDVGTTGTRTIIFDINGKEVAKAYEEYPVIEQSVGISEQDPIIWWNAVKNTCNRALKSINKDDIIGISASFVRGTTTIINDKGEVLHPALTWMDEREEHTALEWKKEEDLRRSIPKLLWIKKNKPDLFNKAYKIIFPDSYIYLRLCDVYVTDPTNGSFGILNTHTLKWDEELANSFGLPIELWPELHVPGEVIGELTSSAAQILGLKKNTPIVLGGGDQQCSSLGLGVIHNGQAKATTGTGTFVDYVVDKPVEPAGDIPIFNWPSVVKGKWNIEGIAPGTGMIFKWFADNFSQLQINKCQEKNINVYDMLTSEAEKISPGSGGLLFLPVYVFRKGTIHGLGWNHTRAHMIRAIMESAALATNMYLNLVEAMGGAKTTELRVDGGAMNSDLWTQIFADVTSRTILVPEVKDGAAMGAAILGFFGCKSFDTFERAIENMVRFPVIKTPNKENSKIYKKLNRIFMPALLDVYSKKRVTKDL
ncbi:MAG: FGGY-family carbohydrate kinase [Candidatus Hermodarchaeota archaeon]